MKQHGQNALYLSKKLEADGYRILYPELESHPQNELMKSMGNKNFGSGGLFVPLAKNDVINIGSNAVLSYSYFIPCKGAN